MSAAQARTYHAEAFSNARDNYYTVGDRIVGRWHGQVREDHFQRLAVGRHPWTDPPLVRHQTACQYTNARGDTVKTMAHHAGWDATVSAPKSISLTALVGGDERVRDAHRASVAVALDETERYVQARLGRPKRRRTGSPRRSSTTAHGRRAAVAHARRLLQSHPDREW